MRLNYENILITHSSKMSNRVYWAGFKAEFKAHNKIVSDVETSGEVQRRI